MIPNHKTMLYRVTLLFVVVVIVVVANIVPRVSEPSAPEADSICEDEIVPCITEVVAEEPPVTLQTELVEEVTPAEIEPEPEVQYEGVLVPSNLTADELRKGLLYELKDYAEEFIQAEKETGINAVFLSSVAALESGWGRSDVATKRNNLFGWTASSGYKVFDSKEECISFVAERIKTLYLSPDGKYFNGYEVHDINIKYNGSQHWEDSVTQIMDNIMNRIEKES